MGFEWGGDGSNIPDKDGCGCMIVIIVCIASLLGIAGTVIGTILYI